MNKISVFSNEQFGELRSVIIDSKPWFVGRDVATILGYNNSRDALRKHVDDEDKGVANCDTPGGTQDMTVINESGLYSLILSSKLPSAKQFKRWVTSDVLPAIRSHGAYLTPELTEQVLSDPDTIIRLATNLKSERAARLAAEQKIAADAHKVLFADSVSQSDDEILVGELAKLLRQNGCDIGQNRLYDQLRQDRFIMKNSTFPTQRAMDLGLFRVIERTIQQPGASPRVTQTTKVTGKGQIYFINRYALDRGFLTDIT